MSVLINPILPVSPMNSQQKAAGAIGFGTDDGSQFSSLLKSALDNLDQSQLDAEVAAAQLVTGQTEDLHTPLIAVEKASLTMGLAVNIRNKVLEAYHEVMRMQI